MHAVGAVALFVGAGLLTLHRHWATPAEVMLNLVAAWWSFEGAGMLADPARLRAFLSVAEAPRRLKVAQAGSFLIGIYLLTIGLAGLTR